jgi:V8-like Glu-specific endopeptidase
MDKNLQMRKIGNIELNKVILLIFVALIYANGYAQQDTLINYNTTTHQIFYYPLVPIDTTKEFEQSGWNYGNYPGRDFLNLEPPDSTYNNSGFTDYIPLQNLYNTNNYPSRTAVKLYRSKNDTLFQLCSGIMVAPEYVLTACHCIGSYDTNGVLIFRDSIWAFPAFDNGIENPLFGKSISIEYVTFNSNLNIGNGFYKKDMALIKLNDRLGISTGWIGIAFSNDDSFFEYNLFHKISYPMTVDPDDSTRIFNGDTLYYNYGTLDLIQEKWIGYNITGIPGQSGSSLSFTDNTGSYSFGTLARSGNSRHLRITPEIYYPFKDVILDSLSHAGDEKVLVDDYFLSNAFPNPFNPSTKFIYEIPSQSQVQIKVFDILGREVGLLVNMEQQKGLYEITFNASDLPSGIYFCRMQSGNFISIKKIILLK